MLNRKQRKTNNILLKRCISCSEKGAKLGRTENRAGWWACGTPMHHDVYLAESPHMEMVVGSIPAQALLCRVGTLSPFPQFLLVFSYKLEIFSTCRNECWNMHFDVWCCPFSTPEPLWFTILRSVNIPVYRSKCHFEWMSSLWKHICPCTCCGFCNVSGNRMWSKTNCFLADGAPDSGQRLFPSCLKQRETWRKKKKNTLTKTLTWPGHVCDTVL